MTVYVSGILLYIAYMVILIFSGSPLMNRVSPQSEEMVLFSAILDPFGLSAFFRQTGAWTVEQRNYQLIYPTGLLLLNRLGVLLISILALAVSVKKFSFETIEKRGRKKTESYDNEKTRAFSTPSAAPSESRKRHLTALLSIAEIDLKYLVKSIPFVIIGIGFLFHLSMEMYGDIEKGIRLPQKYATSALLANTIVDEFHTLCLLMLLFYAQDIFWRSKSANFHLIESATPVSPAIMFFSKWFSLSLVILFFTTLMILLGLVFQFSYRYYSIDWNAYSGVYLFVSAPLMISAGVALIIQKTVNHKALGLVISSVIILLMATPLGNSFLTHPLLRFQMPFSGAYSDMNGFGSYLPHFILRYLFGAGFVLTSAIFITRIPRFSFRNPALSATVLLALGTFFCGLKLSEPYQARNRESEIAASAEYEKLYRNFQDIPQPTVTDVKARIELFPEKNAYIIDGEYILKNKSDQAIESVLVNFTDDFQLIEAEFAGISLKDQSGVVKLNSPLKPSETANFRFKISYEWAAVNGHQSFNAIVENGTFLRISRYFPQIGYLPDNEITDKAAREKYRLGEPTARRTIDEPKDSVDDFINLDMTISTGAKQTAIGVGESVSQWQHDERNYFQYRTSSPIPFRFAVSSAEYSVKKEEYKGKSLEIYYHPTHFQNVDHLLENVKVTLDYCQSGFGPYPFKTIRFAEVSRFTRGFAATAYPASVFMTENMIFDANIAADPKRDVINELAGHELSHLWWGNNQIDPEAREGSAMLTETLAMYSELMIAKKIYGKERMTESVKLYSRMYFDGRGFTEEQPLYRAFSENAHLNYYKGAVVMYQLSETIGEARVNEALKNFLQKHSYPNRKPITADLINEIYRITDESLHEKIDDYFKRITTYEFRLINRTSKKIGDRYEIEFTIEANKFYGDGKGGQTLVEFNDELEMDFEMENGERSRQSFFVKGNRLAAKVRIPGFLKETVIDPRILFLKKVIE
jgi:ABC-2 type transport system permease protein